MKNYVTNTVEAITEYLNDLSNSELVRVHNDYCRSVQYDNDEIYDNDEEFFNMFFEGKVLEAVRAVSFGEYRYQDEYIVFNGYGNLETFNSPADRVDIAAIAADILGSPENYDNIELEEAEETESE